LLLFISFYYDVSCVEPMRSTGGSFSPWAFEHWDKTATLFLFSLFSSPETVPGGGHSLCRVLCWYLLLTGNNGRRLAVLLFIFYVLFFSLLLTGDITGGEAFFFSDDFAGIFSSPETPPGGGQPRFSSSSTFCFLSSPHRRHYRGGGILSLSFFFFAGIFSSPETPPGGGQPCFSASLRRRLVRGTNAQHFWLSLSMGVHELGHERQGSCLNRISGKPR